MTAIPSSPITDPVLIERKGALGRIRLNRPKALNSLTLDMVRRIERALDAFAADGDIRAVLITGEGERGLCAGGDIRAIFDSGRAKDGLGETFWREEYQMNACIAAYAKPYIALMDGITMGGGVGVSAHGRHRIVTERTRLAMPETGIGFFPDIGGTWLLSRAPGEIGTYLGLTGAQIGAGDAIYAGFADIFVPIEKAPGLVEGLAALSSDSTAGAAIAAFAGTSPDAPLAAQRSLIDDCFAFDRVEDILAALTHARTPFASDTHAALMAKSPTSLKLTLRLLRLARQSADLETCLAREFAAAARILDGHDFYEGVRAAVIDKDRNPRWSPDTLDAVSAQDIDAYLAPGPEPIFKTE